MDFKATQTAQKLRGGYYTPNDIANFLSRWIAQSSPARVLEPSAGDGVFIPPIGLHAPKTCLEAFELDEVEAGKARERLAVSRLTNSTVQARDFLEWSLSHILSGQQCYDAVVGNPPFIRYQYLPGGFQYQSQRIFDTLGCKFTKHTNAWVPFLLASMALLKPGGRLAMVVPSEIVHVMHAQSLRSYLGRECRRLVILDPEEIWFEDTLQGAVILMAEKAKSNDAREGLAIIPVRGRKFLQEDPQKFFESGTPINGKTISGKWTRALIGAQCLSLLEELDAKPGYSRFADRADVAVGIVTGANSFFLVPDQTVSDYGLEEWSHPMFGRSDHCPGIVYDEAQHEQNAEAGKPTNFLWFKDQLNKTNRRALSYIERGQADDLHKRYKCRIRSPWYAVPSVYSSPVGMLKRAHDTPRLILNEVGAYTTDTAYRIKPKSVSSEKLVFGFHNPLTALSAELEGRHYGGGVLELVPSEIRQLRLPDVSKVEPDIERLDRDVRNLETELMLERQGKLILGAQGVSASNQDVLLDAWSRLRNRRQRKDSAAN